MSINSIKTGEPLRMTIYIFAGIFRILKRDILKAQTTAPRIVPNNSDNRETLTVAVKPLRMVK